MPALRLLPLIAVLACAPMAAAAAPKIPPEIIAACREDVPAHRMPACLREGALAVEMFAWARSPEGYGAAADRVEAACRAGNDDLAAALICFRNAARTAVETRELIGLENIADACVAGLSDPGALARLKTVYDARRDAYFPDEMFSGGGMYSPFKGCPSAKPAGAAPVDASDAEANADAKAEAGAEAEAECAAIADVGARIHALGPDRAQPLLKALGRARTEGDAAEALSMGLSPDTIAFAAGAGEEALRRFVLTVTAVLARDAPGALGAAPADDDSFGRAVFRGLLDRLAARCAPQAPPAR